MTRNLRTQLANAAERWMRAWAGDDLARESAEVLYTYWDLADPNDDELRAEVLSRFPASEPPAVAGMDFLAVEQDAKTTVAESLPKRRWRDPFGCFWVEHENKPGHVLYEDRTSHEVNLGVLLEYAVEHYGLVEVTA